MKAFKIRRNGQEYYRVDIPKHLFTDGKRHSVMARTRREALEKAENLVQRRKKGLDVAGASTSLSDFLERFLAFYRTEGGVALRTWQDYRYHVDKNIVPHIGAVPLAELKPLAVDQWIKSLRERGLGDRTLAYALAVLRRALQFALEWELIDRNPAAARFRAAKRRNTARTGGQKVHFLNPTEARTFLDAVHGDRHEPLYALAITTGLRPEELYGLRFSDVDLPHLRLTVNQVIARTRGKRGEKMPRFVISAPKTERSRRTIDFPRFIAGLIEAQSSTVEQLRALAGGSWQEHGLVFPSNVGTPLDERNALRRFQEICGENGLPKLRLYDLRHTHASLLIHEGVHPKRISERLGHSSIKLTMDTYGHLFEGSDRDSADTMERLLGARQESGRLLTMPDRKRVADKTADKNTKTRSARAAK